MTTLQLLQIEPEILFKNYKVKLKQDFTWVEVLPYVTFKRDELINYISQLSDTFIDWIQEWEDYVFVKEDVKRIIFDMNKTSLDEMSLLIEKLLDIITKSVEYGTESKDNRNLTGISFLKKIRGLW